MTRKLVWLCILVSLSIFCQPFASSAALRAKTVSIIVNGRFVRLNPTALILAGRVLVPLRGTAEAMGASVSLVRPRTIVIIRGARVVQLEIGSRVATVNNTRVAMDVPPLEAGGYTYVPLRFVGESLGASVRYHPATYTVEIVTTTESEESLPVPPPEPEIEPVPAPLPPVDAQPTPSPSPRPARPTVVFPFPGTSVGNPVAVQGTAPGATRVRVTVSVPVVGIPIGSTEASVLPIVGVFSASVGYPPIFSGLPLTINVVAIDGAGMESEPVTIVVRQR